MQGWVLEFRCLGQTQKGALIYIILIFYTCYTETLFAENKLIFLNYSLTIH